MRNLNRPLKLAWAHEIAHLVLPIPLAQRSVDCTDQTVKCELKVIVDSSPLKIDQAFKRFLLVLICEHIAKAATLFCQTHVQLFPTFTLTFLFVLFFFSLLPISLNLLSSLQLCRNCGITLREQEEILSITSTCQTNKITYDSDSD